MQTRTIAQAIAFTGRSDRFEARVAFVVFDVPAELGAKKPGRHFEEADANYGGNITCLWQRLPIVDTVPQLAKARRLFSGSPLGAVKAVDESGLLVLVLRPILNIGHKSPGPFPAGVEVGARMRMLSTRRLCAQGRREWWHCCARVGFYV